MLPWSIPHCKTDEPCPLELPQQYQINPMFYIPLLKPIILGSLDKNSSCSSE